MRRSELRNVQLDWRGWVALTWALWFGWQYAKMVVDVRGAKMHRILSAPAHADRPAEAGVQASR